MIQSGIQLFLIIFDIAEEIKKDVESFCEKNQIELIKKTKSIQKSKRIKKNLD